MKAFQMIKQGATSVVSGDSSAYPQGQATYNDKATNFIRLSPLGLDSNPKDGRFVLLFSSQGQEAVKFGIVAAMSDRFKPLAEDEIAVYNPTADSYYHFKNDGTVDINIPTDKTETIGGNHTINITGNVTQTVGGNITQTVTGNVTLSAVNLNATLTGALTANITSNSVITVPELRINGNLVVNGVTNTTTLLIGGVPSPGISKVVGDLQVVAGGGGTGAINAAGLITGSGGVTDGTVALGAHVHTNVQTGTSNTGGPI